MPLSAERARELTRELGGWFGPPLLCRVAPRNIVKTEEIIDGRIRFEACVFDLDKSPYVVFPVGFRGGIYSEDGKLLPRLLAVFGHPDRSWIHVPEHWRDSLGALESFLGVRRETAIEVWAAGAALREKVRCKQIKGRKDHTHAEKVRRLRTIVRAYSAGEACGMAEVAEILGVKL